MGVQQEEVLRHDETKPRVVRREEHLSRQAREWHDYENTGDTGSLHVNPPAMTTPRGTFTTKKEGTIMLFRKVLPVTYQVTGQLLPSFSSLSMSVFFPNHSYMFFEFKSQEYETFIFNRFSGSIYLFVVRDKR
jgi:hypothetical protein